MHRIPGCTCRSLPKCSCLCWLPRAANGLIKPLVTKLLLVLLQRCCYLSLGDYMRRLNLPPVGELLAGVVLGPSLFGWIFPSLQAHISEKPGSVRPPLGSLPGLLLIAGHQPDHRLIARQASCTLLRDLAWPGGYCQRVSG